MKPDSQSEVGAQDTPHTEAAQTATRASLLQQDNRSFIRSDLGAEAWVTIHRPSALGLDGMVIFSELVPKNIVARDMRHSSWDYRSDSDQLSGYVEVQSGGIIKKSYSRYGDESGREPLAIIRRFSLEKALESVEINETFRLYFNLWHDRQRNAYLRFDRDGNSQDIVRINDGVVQVDGAALKQFLGARGMSLILKFSIRRTSELSLAAVGLVDSLDAARVEVREPLLAYDWFCYAGVFTSFQSCSELSGKKVIEGRTSVEDPSPYRERERQFESFIIGRSGRGDDVVHTCDPSTLGNLFGRNPGSPQALTPVFFRREVLQKYFARPDRYEVGDGFVRLGDMWYLDIDNNHDRYVIAFLGDLGQSLSDGEQRYWRSYNVPPDGGLSAVSFSRAIRGDFADAQRPDLVFKERFAETNAEWERIMGWSLFLPLASGDAHYMAALRVPLADTDIEFDAQILALAKIMVDSLNESALVNACPAAAELEGSISRYEQYGKANALPELESHVSTLQAIQALRSSSVAHRKGSRFTSLKSKLGFDSVDRISAFEQILRSAARMLVSISAHLRTLAPGAGSVASDP